MRRTMVTDVTEVRTLIVRLMNSLRYWAANSVFLDGWAVTLSAVLGLSALNRRVRSAGVDVIRTASRG